MENMNSFFVIATSIGAILMAILAMFIRMKSAKKPATVKKILLPPLFMSTGALMYVFPEFRLTQKEMLEAAIIGILFSFLLIKTSKFEIRNQDIYLKRSRAFMYILVGLLVFRMIAKLILTSSIDYGELSGMFYLLAFSMILPWRIAMFLNYRKVSAELSEMNDSSKPLT
jgi:membrane protein CcdC involved in cytochrome C biogenesis